MPDDSNGINVPHMSNRTESSVNAWAVLTMGADQAGTAAKTAQLELFGE
jgi:hypothetical protein